MELFHIISGCSGAASSATTSLLMSTSSSVFPVRPSAQTVDNVPSALSSAAIAPIAPTTVHPLIHSCSLSSQSPVPSQMLYARTSTSASHNYDPSVQHFNHCTLNIQNFFGPQSSQLGSTAGSRVESQIASDESGPVRKRRKDYITDFDED